MISITKILWHLTIQSDFFTQIIVFSLCFFSLFSFILFFYEKSRLEKKYNSANEILKKIKTENNFLKEKNSIFSLAEEFINKEKNSKDEIYEILSNILHSYMQKDRDLRLYFLICAGSAPLVGLLGTVWGVIHAFMGMSSGGDLSAVAPGIAEALITTLGGLFVAIPCLIFYHLTNNYIKKVYATYSLLFWHYLTDIKTKSEDF